MEQTSETQRKKIDAFKAKYKIHCFEFVYSDYASERKK